MSSNGRHRQTEAWTWADWFVGIWLASFILLPAAILIWQYSFNDGSMWIKDYQP